MAAPGRAPVEYADERRHPPGAGPPQAAVIYHR